MILIFVECLEHLECFELIFILYEILVGNSIVYFFILAISSSYQLIQDLHVLYSLWSLESILHTRQ